MSNYNMICDRIKSIFSSQINDPGMMEALQYDTPLASLGIDSIRSMIILIEVENFFNIKIDDTDIKMEKMKSIHCLAELVMKYM